MARLENAIDTETMMAMNARVRIDRVPESVVAAEFLRDHLKLEGDVPVQKSRLSELARTVGVSTVEHLILVAISLTFAVVVAVPLGVLAYKVPQLGQSILALVGVVQTIPSLALLVFMIPFLGLGATPVLVALLLYSLLPIVRNTYQGLVEIPLSLRESAEVIGLPPRARLWRVELPLASRSILSGIKTAAVINVGTATIGAIIGAGGYGQPILTGIRLNDLPLILSGAVPAALMAVLVQQLFGWLERFVVPRGLRVA
jgi:osmoprotectant transport system permease protein